MKHKDQRAEGELFWLPVILPPLLCVPSPSIPRSTDVKSKEACARHAMLVCCVDGTIYPDAIGKKKLVILLPRGTARCVDVRVPHVDRKLRVL